MSPANVGRSRQGPDNLEMLSGGCGAQGVGTTTTPMGTSNDCMMSAVQARVSTRGMPIFLDHSNG